MRPYQKLIFVICVVLSTLNVVKAQNKKDIYLQAGLSSGYGYHTELSSLPDQSISTVNFGIGYSFTKLYQATIYVAYSYESTVYEAWKGWDLGIKNTFHIGRLFLKNDKIDIYASVITGYSQRSRTYTPETSLPDYYYDLLNYKKNDFTIGGLIGFQHFFSKKLGKKLGVYGEIGYTRELFIGGGLSVKLNK